MKRAWIVLIVSALTDAFVVATAGITSAMMATGVVAIPNRAVIFLNVLLGGMAAARTIQQALKSTPETSAALTGNQSIVETKTIEKTP